ncbi:protein ENHANCED DISEASE RESISTANCE 4-like isoform X2 [Tripterygium wilfordii]|uniref:protein ENHANCED DISEASE RESISTANCE 4-like isoform X2 n=1 Tax=Tripterygium wilfordii TaxID=458696 RepID=UPI0018F84C95|nr:protein ENHANCED DISEASE RESISTANCE 4-like isoform X2 [Tripterygium wilfordii]
MAGDGSKLRLVRCPKCLNLLPEHPDVSVYKCGACGALLRAKKKGPATRSREGHEKWHGLLEKEDHGIVTASETEMETSEIENNRRKERAFRDKNVNLINRSSPRTEDKQVMLDNGRNERDYNTDTGRGFYRSKADKVIGCADKSRQALKHPIDDDDRNVKRSVNFIKEKGVGENSPSMKNSAESLRSRVFVDRWGAERDVHGGCYVNHKGVSGQGKFSARANTDEGPSHIKNREGLYGPNRVREPEQDQAELLRKLDELKDKLSALCNATDKPKDRAPINAKFVPSDAYGGTLTHDGSAKHFAWGNPRHFNNGKGHAPSVNSHDIDMHNSYFPQHAPNGIPGYEDLYRLHMLGTLPNHSTHQYPKRPGHDYLSEQHMNISRDHGPSHPQKTMYHQPGCSCSFCYNLNWQAPSQIPLVDLGHRRLHENPINSNFYHHATHASHFVMGTQNYSPQASHPLLHSHDQLQHTGWPSDIESDVDGFGRMHLRKETVAPTRRQLCYPILGGAPFITCCSCFELLKLPHIFKAREKSRQRLRCGACSTVNFLKVKDNKLIILVSTENDHLTANADNGSNEVSGEGVLSSLGCVDTNDKNSFATDYDLHSTGVKDNVMSEEQKSRDSNKRHGGTSSCSISYEKEESCSISYEKEESLDNIIVHGDVSSEVPAEDDAFPSKKYSHSAENFSNPSPELALSRYGEGKLSKQTNQENLILNKSESGQKFVEAVSLVTEAVSFNEDLNTSVSQESMAASVEEDRARINKGNKSFLKGLIKKSFRDFSRANQNMKTIKVNVWINGQPIPDLVVKKAEILAGPIQPGDYWYDSRSGFWGVTGQPCLGIIPCYYCFSLLLKNLNIPWLEIVLMETLVSL